MSRCPVCAAMSCDCSFAAILDYLPVETEKLVGNNFVIGMTFPMHHPTPAGAALKPAPAEVRRLLWACD